MGSGHILCVLFDVLVQIYEDYGYAARQAVPLIVEKNLWGLDIDERAAQLAYFAVMMKARQYDRRFFSRGVQPHVYSPGAYKEGQEFGSLIVVDELEPEPVEDKWSRMEGTHQANVDAWQFRRALAQKYHVVVTNPPYRGISDVSASLLEYTQTNYPNSYSDLSTAFMEKCVDLVKYNGYMSMINIPVWMTLASYAELRKELLESLAIVNALDFGRGVFGSDFGTVSFTIRNNALSDYIGHYSKFYNRKVEVESIERKHELFFKGTKNYNTKQSLFLVLPNCLIAYSSARSLVRILNNNHRTIGDYATVFEGLKTRDKERFLRFWYEIINTKWKKYAKGGSFRRWYGNTDYVVKWGETGDEIKAYKKSSGGNFKYYFTPSITYTAMTMSAFSGRFIDRQIFGGGGGGITNCDHTEYILGLVNSCVFNMFISAMKSTVNYEVGQIKSVPVLCSSDYYNKVVSVVKNCIATSQTDWDSFETSWDFQRHPLVRSCPTVEAAFHEWETECNQRFNQLKANEEELNRIFIDIYGLQDELTPEVEDKDVTVRKADLQREIRSLISYAVGCMFGRYSLDVPGLVYAGGNFDTKYCRWIEQFGENANEFIDENGELIEGGWAGCTLWEYDGIRKDGKWVKATFAPDTDNIIPICDDEYFEDDIVGRFVEFIRVVYGENTLEENLRFIADALGGKGSPREVIRNYFLNDFYKDHCKIYQKRPIYWLFDSGKKNGFKCLVYLHRYKPDTIARIRTDYVHEQQSRYRTAIADLERRSTEGSASDKVRVKKQLARIQAQADELRVYEEKIHHLADQMIAIDLDDGVKKNYAIFKDVLAKIK